MWEQLNEGLAEMAARARRGIVEIYQPGRGAGTGIVVGAEGLVVTNAHVVRKRYPHVRLADGRRLRAQLVGYDEAADLAALAVEADALDALELGNSKAVRAGDFVQAVGHPWGLVGAATTGVIVDVEGTWVGAGRRAARPDWLVADLHLWPGNSGGPLLDAEGRVLGVNTMLLGSGLGVAVPAHRVRAFLNRTRRERRAFV